MIKVLNSVQVMNATSDYGRSFVQAADDQRVQELRVEQLLSCGASDVLLYDRLHIATGQLPPPTHCYWSVATTYTLLLVSCRRLHVATCQLPPPTHCYLSVATAYTLLLVSCHRLQHCYWSVATANTLLLVCCHRQCIATGQLPPPTHCYLSVATAYTLLLVSCHHPHIATGQLPPPTHCYWSVATAYTMLLVSCHCLHNATVQLPPTTHCYWSVANPCTWVLDSCHCSNVATGQTLPRVIHCHRSSQLQLLMLPKACLTTLKRNDAAGFSRHVTLVSTHLPISSMKNIFCIQKTFEVDAFVRTFQLSSCNL